MSDPVGYGHLTPSSPEVRLISILYGGFAAPLLALLIAQLTSVISSILAIRASDQTSISTGEVDDSTNVCSIT